MYYVMCTFDYWFFSKNFITWIVFTQVLNDNVYNHSDITDSNLENMASPFSYITNTPKDC